MQQITHDLTKAAHVLRVRSFHKKTVKKRFAPSFYCFYCRSGPLGARRPGRPKLENRSGEIKAHAVRDLTAIAARGTVIGLSGEGAQCREQAPEQTSRRRPPNGFVDRSSAPDLPCASAGLSV